jgi:LPXTG-site transpeptidase (sortase) family protein
LVIHTATVTINAAVAPLSVASYQPVDPPHNTAQQWATAAWIVESAFPTRSSRGTSYIYGHACNYHVCPFTNLKDTKVGDRVQITTSTGSVTYQIDRIGLSSKAAKSLPAWASDSTVPGRLVLVTCSHEYGDWGLDNIVVTAHLAASAPTRFENVSIH